MGLQNRRSSDLIGWRPDFAYYAWKRSKRRRSAGKLGALAWCQEIIDFLSSASSCRRLVEKRRLEAVGAGSRCSWVVGWLVVEGGGGGGLGGGGLR